MRPRSAIVCIVGCAACLLAAAAQSDLDIAREALRDGLWDIARAHAEKVNTDDARLLVLESLAGERNWQEIGKRLATWPETKGPGFDYYRAVLKGDHEGAMRLLKTGGSQDGFLEARMSEAESLAKSGKTEAARQIWKEIMGVTNAGERVFVHASVNLMDVEALRHAYEASTTAARRRFVGLRLGRALLARDADAAEGARLIRTIARDSPDTDGARDAFLALADSEISREQWSSAAATLAEAIEIWPEAVKLVSVQEGLGWTALRLGRLEASLESFQRAESLATNDLTRAKAVVKQGDVLSEMGRGDEALAKYREAVAKYPSTPVAARLKSVIEVRELERKGRESYRNYGFEEARKAFRRVAELDAGRKSRMDFFDVLCLYGQGDDEAASAQARLLAEKCPDEAVKTEAKLWLAKFLYNNREWKSSAAFFLACAEASPDNPARAAESTLWAARAVFAENDFARAIALSSQLLERYPTSPFKHQALLLQGEALIELSRFDEAVLVFERVMLAESVPTAERIRAQMLRADALYAMGADNPARYAAALEAYRSIRFGGTLALSARLVISFKIARTLEKLKRLDEAIDQYYSQVVLAYRDGRVAHEHFNDEARAAFSRAAFRLADEYESRGKDQQALAVLNLVAKSDVPAADEAVRRMERISKKGRFL